jgi:MFS family permease
MGVSGFTNSFLAFALCRPLLGILSSIFNPLSFSLLADYFPADRRATANSIIQSGNYIGWGLSSISILSIKAFGWRKTYGILGAVALAVSALVLTAVKEPAKVEKEVVAKAAEETGDDKEEKGGVRDVLSNPINKYTLIGAFFRNFGGSCTTFFLPLFFLKNFPGFKV